MIGVSINPTSLAVGKTGRLDSHAATVVGRAVLESADRYRWHEYYVRLDSGRMIILVYETGVWKRFDEFKPNKPFAGADAGTQRVGDFVALHGEAAKIKYVSTSRVLYSEGQTWDGVRAGSEANYFNAEYDSGMVVVSWTGDEIEFFNGKTLASYTVPHAFHLSEPALWRKLMWVGSGSLDADLGSGVALTVFLFILLGALVVCWVPWESTPATVAPPPVTPAPSLRLEAGSSGTLAGDHFTLRGRTLVEIDEPGARFQRYEYDLLDDQGGRAVLIQDVNGNPHEWALFHATSAPGKLNPNVAAVVNQGGTLRFRGRAAHVQRLLLTRTLEGMPDGTATGAPGVIRYGFLAREGETWILARWTESALEWDEGRSVAEPMVLDAFRSVTPQTP